MVENQMVEATTLKAAKKVPSLPNRQTNLAALGKTVHANWVNLNPNTVFKFVSQTDFDVLVTKYDTSVNAKRSRLSDRVILTEEMTVIMDDINSKLGNLKTYIEEEYGKESAQSHFSKFGIIHKNNKYTFPRDRDEMLTSLNDLIAALASSSRLSNQKYGLAFWTDLRDTLQNKWNSAKSIDGEVSIYTADIRMNEALLKAYLRRIKAQLKVDFPDTYKQVWRSWGFQEEKF